MAGSSSAAPAMVGSASVSSRPARKQLTTSPAPAALLAHGHPTVAEIDARPPHFRNIDLVGMTVGDAAALAGQTVEATKRWLNHNRYRWTDGIICRSIASVSASEDEISDRIASARPSGPCFRCGAARQCEHR